MVWIVVDTNQAIRMKVLPEPSLGANIEGISLSPFVLGELLRSNNRRPLENLAKYPVRIGMSPGEVMDLIARRRRSQIVTCRPFLNLPTMQVREYLLSPSLQKDREREFVDTVKTHIETIEFIQFSHVQNLVKLEILQKDYGQPGHHLE